MVNMETMDLRTKSRNEKIIEIEEMLYNPYNRFVVVEGTEKDVLEYAKDANEIIHMKGHDKSHIKGGGFEDYLVSGLNIDNNVTVVTLYDNVNHALDPTDVAEHIADTLYSECHCLACALIFGGMNDVAFGIEI